ncbi:M16 family metallopeptidase [Yersinia vastinensis]|uniref:M16 family metallopeptidase n=1 Tax=Yersinia vastinensis TaxID=2890318 RepID=UPI0005E9A309|nr:pitrilysin family protein [Yersinia vastinensis]CNK97795.1 exported Zinc protease [Yersinia frederiksenii]
MTRILRYWSAGFLLLLTGGSVAYAQEISSPAPEIIEGKLANGLRYLLVPLVGQNGRVDIRLIVGAGSLDEENQQSGVAHMVEHMVFHSSKNYPQGVSEFLHKQGWVRAQHYNAMTNYERTAYLFSPPKGNKQLSEALAVLSQMAGYSNMTQPEWDRERQIVYEEWRSKLGVAERMNQQRIQAIRFASRYPERPVIGDEKNIRILPVSELNAFYQRWYVPSNMHLIITGDIDREKVQQEINRYFAPLSGNALAARNYYEPTLSTQLRVVRLQDSQSGGSQVSWVYRFDESASRATGYDGLYARLVDQIALTALSRQLRRQQDTFPPAVSTMVIRKSFIGRTTSALGIFAQVTPDGHHHGLTQIQSEIQRLQRYPIAAEDINDIKQELLETLAKSNGREERRDFAEWVQKVSDTLVQDKPMTSQNQINQWAATALKYIDADKVNARIQRWLSSPDRLVQFTVPGSAPFVLPTSGAILRADQHLNNTVIAPLKPKPKAIAIPALPVIKASGTVVHQQHYPQQHVNIWHLSNGDRVVWLRSPQAGKKVWFTAVSHAGFMSPDLNPWQAQLAAQLVQQSGPQGWSAEQFSDWRKQQGLSLSFNQSPTELQISGQTDTAKLDNLLRLYHSLHQQPQIAADVMKESLSSLLRMTAKSADSVGDNKEQLITQLRFGKEAFARPTRAQLMAINQDELLSQWRRSAAAPATFYLVTDMEPTDLQAKVSRYLAGIPRQKIAAAPDYLPQPGHRETRNKWNVEPRSDLNVWSFTPLKWTPQQAVQVAIAQDLARKYLKAALRDDSLGIYRMKIDSTLTDKKNRVETTMSFGSEPARIEALLRQAEQIFAQLPALITEQDIHGAVSHFKRNQASRLSDPATQMRLLILSDENYGDPHYLTEVKSLADSITLPGVRAAAAQLYNPNNSVVSIVQPRQQKAEVQGNIVHSGEKQP